MTKVTVNCNNIANREDMHDALSKALCFPEWYGKNLDALADMLTSISEETLIEFTDFSSLGNFAGSFGEVFTDSASINPKLKIFLN